MNFIFISAGKITQAVCGSLICGSCIGSMFYCPRPVDGCHWMPNISGHINRPYHIYHIGKRTDWRNKCRWFQRRRSTQTKSLQHKVVNDFLQPPISLYLCSLSIAQRGASLAFDKGCHQAQVSVKIFQNQICLGEWPEMWWNTQYIDWGAISYKINQLMRVLSPPIHCPNQKMKLFMKK